MTNRLVRATVIGGVGVVLATAVPATAQAAAVVIRNRQVVDCYTEAGNLPFLPVPEVGIENSTVVLTPRGGLNVTCFGQLPEGISPPAKTYQAWVPCHSDTDVVQGHIVVTASGRVTMTCHFPPPA
ncbi:hypothetical protein JD79_03993 [Geodermatophilus normandii]|uniref:Ig-like domain-containing protein n=1 Tax=Geodermatophilus normandii TaxID=1137989 RepID=A0A317QN61_9ACTN|nr:hypothetical protein [Geodermatophilus normandii]PWW24802.1 hypothetical protein JD79_03993 [Geodermatophilus normandii]